MCKEHRGTSERSVTAHLVAPALTYSQKQLAGLCRPPISAFQGSFQIFWCMIVPMSLRSCCALLCSCCMAPIKLFPSFARCQCRVLRQKSRDALLARTELVYLIRDHHCCFTSRSLEGLAADTLAESLGRQLPATRTSISQWHRVERR